MNLKYCTFTGIDEKFSLEQLEILASRHPFLEWGILFSTTSNNNRYPNEKWFELVLPQIFNIIEKTNNSLALHVCGKETINLIDNTNSFFDFLLPHFNRVQLNFIYSDDKKDKLMDLFKYYPDINFITQDNYQNRQIKYEFLDIENHSILFDSSGGRGFIPKEINPPLTDKFCGYAGGMGPDNIQKMLSIIDDVCEQPYWIDMENNIRTNDWLDYSKCLEVAKVVQSFLYKKTLNFN